MKMRSTAYITSPNRKGHPVVAVAGGGNGRQQQPWIRSQDFRIALIVGSVIAIFGIERFAIRLTCAAGFGSATAGVRGTSSVSEEYTDTGIVDNMVSDPKPVQPWDEEPLPRELQFTYTTTSLLDRTHPLVLKMQNTPLTNYYKNYTTVRNFSGDCSCLNPYATQACCQRTFRRSHKMGCVMSMNLLQQYPNQYKLAAEPKYFTYNLKLPETDYRDVLVLRDLYSSILSGYLYHYKGFECKMPDKIRDYLGEWDTHISYQLKPPANGKSICQYLAKTQPATGMRAYIDWVMRYYYAPLFSHYVMGLEIPEMKERTLAICYEDLMSKDHDVQAVQTMVQFFFNGTPPVEWDGTPPGHAKIEVGYKGGHATTNDRTAEEKESLIQLIKNIDEQIYHGEIAWLNSINPCSKETLEKRNQAIAGAIASSM